MIIDFHTHTFPDLIAPNAIKSLGAAAHVTPSLDGTRGGLSDSMKDSGVDISVEFSVATNPRQVPKLNELVIADAEVDNGIITFGSMHPGYDEYESEIDRLAGAGVKGIKIHPVYQKCAIDDEKFLRIFRSCVEHDMIVVTHAGYDIGFPGVDLCGPVACRNVMDKVPDLKFVLAHMGGWKQWDEVKEVLSDTPAYIDTAFSLGSIVPIQDENYYTDDQLRLLSKEQFLSMVEVFGPDRILFATDSPWAGQPETLSFIRNAGLDPDTEAKILGDNAKRLLGK